jgi:two-component system chemotaxis response regulator CheB
MEKSTRPDTQGRTPEPSRQVRVLIADDSASVRAYLAHIMECAGLTVAGFARDGEEAVRQAVQLSPSVITMDIDMPGIDGLTATTRIMEVAPAPIVIVSAHYDKTQMRKTFAALEAGALAIIEKPSGADTKECTEAARELGRMVALLAKVRIARRPILAPKVRESQSATACEAYSGHVVRLAAIGASTGGPQSLRAILSNLAPEVGVPIVVIQHMAPGFMPGMIEWLASMIRLPVEIATDAGTALPGRIYFAPDGFHLEIDATLRFSLTRGSREHGVVPSVSHLLRSVAENFGKESLAVLLSGMGSDGAQELKLLGDMGACTVIQNEETCAVFGMPGAALRLGAKPLALPPKGIADLINSLPQRKEGPGR